jgi:hypothetical protein
MFLNSGLLQVQGGQAFFVLIAVLKKPLTPNGDRGKTRTMAKFFWQGEPKLRDELIIRRGPGRAYKDPFGWLVVVIAAAIPFVVFGGFAAGGIVGAGLAVSGGTGAAGLVGGSATGAVWGGILGVVSLAGAACGLGLVDSLLEKKQLKREQTYHAAVARQQAAVKIAASETAPALAMPSKGAATEAFLKVQKPEGGAGPGVTPQDVIVRSAPPRAA